ncbi:MAG: dynamin family protein [Actinomycetota bacterium]|nr:dynamin family protein [Actinomycetota bacterium]
MSTVTETAERSGMEHAVRDVLRHAMAVYADDPAATAVLGGHLDRLDEPLRVAIAGKMKSGKSTLLNALIGEEIAPTDASECTRVVTWYEHGPRPRVTLHPTAGPSRELAIRRADGRLALDLGEDSPEQIDRLEIEWPSPSLRPTTLVDTPGIDSPSAAVSQRTTRFLTPEDEPSAADAIVYLLRHLHASDVHFLESFRDTALGRATMVNTVGVLSRADEIGAGRIDALLSARVVAARYRDHPVVRQLCSTVVPVAGLLAQAGRTLRQSEYADIEALAGTPRDVTEGMLISVDRFVRADAPVPVPAEQRAALLDRLGVFGVRLAITFVRAGMRDATALAQELARRSGLDEVRQLLTVQFSERSGLLKGRSAVLGLERVLRDRPRAGTEAISAVAERIVAEAHELRELTLLHALRGSRVSFAAFGTGEDLVAERLLGAAGIAPTRRLGLGPNTTDAELRAASRDAVRVWRARAASTLVDPETTAACHVVVRSCEGVLADL